jgi:uncharacterized Zn finger protein
MKKAGTTWWGLRWIEALEHVLGGDSGRLARGRTYARAGRTHDLVIKGGKVTTKVTGSRATPYKITLTLGQLEGATWEKAIATMAKKAQFSADLLAGRMPQQIDEAFHEAGVSLFPTRRSDLETSCSCPDWGDPCKHVAAAHYVLGEALDRDPFLLFELRGKSKEQVLAALRAARGVSDEDPSPKTGKPKRPHAVEEHEVPTVTLGKIEAADYDRPRQALPSLHFLLQTPPAHGAALRQLGAPASWQGESSPADVLAPLVRAAAATARRLALAEPSDTEPPPVPTPRAPSPKVQATRKGGTPSKRAGAKPRAR